MHAWLMLSACLCFYLCCRDGAEQLSVDRAMRAVSRAEISVIVLDGSEGVTQQVRVDDTMNTSARAACRGLV
jgi:predicted GTPase